MKPNRITAEQIAEAGKLHSNGWSYTRIGEKLGVHRQTVKRALDPEYAAYRSRQVLEAWRKREGYHEIRQRVHKREAAASINLHLDVAARLAEIPPDTRDLTGRLFGDPLPGRSALARQSSPERR